MKWDCVCVCVCVCFVIVCLHTHNLISFNLLDVDGLAVYRVSGRIHSKPCSGQWSWFDRRWAADRCILCRDTVSSSGQFILPQSWESVAGRLHQHHWLVRCIYHAALYQASEGNSFCFLHVWSGLATLLLAYYGMNHHHHHHHQLYFKHRGP